MNSGWNRRPTDAKIIFIPETLVDCVGWPTITLLTT